MGGGSLAGKGLKCAFLASFSVVLLLLVPTLWEPRIRLFSGIVVSNRAAASLTHLRNREGFNLRVKALELGVGRMLGWAQYCCPPRQVEFEKGLYIIACFLSYPLSPFDSLFSPYHSLGSPGLYNRGQGQSPLLANRSLQSSQGGIFCTSQEVTERTEGLHGRTTGRLGL